MESHRLLHPPVRYELPPGTTALFSHRGTGAARAVPLAARHRTNSAIARSPPHCHGVLDLALPVLSDLRFKVKRLGWESWRRIFHPL